MKLKQTILEYVPIVAGAATAAVFIGTGVAEELSDVVASGLENLKPVIESGGAASVFLGIYYAQKVHQDFLGGV